MRTVTATRAYQGYERQEAILPWENSNNKTTTLFIGLLNSVGMEALSAEMVKKFPLD